MNKVNGHTQIENQVLEALLRADLNTTQIKLALAVIRKTWGWRKQADRISWKELSQMIGKSRRTVSKELTRLKDLNILVQTKEPTNRKPAEWKVNRDFESWGEADNTPRGEVNNTPRGEGSCTSKESRGEVNDTPRGEADNTPGVKRTTPLEVKRTAPSKEKERNLAKERKETVASRPDPRHQPFVDFFHEEYEKATGSPLVTHASDYGQLSQTLKKLKGISLERLEAAAERFIWSDDPFHQKQGHPLRFFAANINAFLKARDPTELGKHGMSNLRAVEEFLQEQS